MSFRVIKPGFHSSIQDLGRFGFAHLGLARSGAMDQHASRWANYLLENDQNDAVLEITFGQCELEAQASTTIAVTGADMAFQINGQTKTNWQTHVVNAGDRLRWLNAQSGVSAYLSVKGGLQTECYFESRSVNVRENIGRLLKKGDRLAFKTNKQAVALRSTPTQFQHDYQSPLTLRLLASYQFEQFSPQQQKQFFEQRYHLANESDRTGYRLSGLAIEQVPAQMISEGMAYGSVEITSAGLPIILMNDAPTIGGYPKIGTVFSLDLAQLAQRQPGATINFERITIEQAQQASKVALDFFNRQPL